MKLLDMTVDASFYIENCTILNGYISSKDKKNKKMFCRYVYRKLTKS